MPGVPSYRGCEACRRVKKKCDQRIPACLRCTRLRIPCHGVGLQRFRFITHSNGSSFDSGIVPLPHRANAEINTTTDLGQPSSPLTSKHNPLLSELVFLLQVEESGYDVYSCGAFIAELPKMVGHSPTHDAAITTFSSLLMAVRTGHMTVRVEFLRQYVKALGHLQRDLLKLGDGYSRQTLCSIYLLMLCHDWVAKADDGHVHHGVAIARLISKAMEIETGWEKDTVAFNMLTSIGAMTLVEAIFDPSIPLHPWVDKLSQKLFLSKPDSKEKGQQITLCRIRSMEMSYFALIPEVIHHPRGKVREMQWLYKVVLVDYRELKDYYESAFLSGNFNRVLVSMRADLVERRIFHSLTAFMQLMAIILNTLLRLYSADTEDLRKERAMFCDEAVILGERAKVELPMAAIHIPHALFAAFVVADSVQKPKLKQLMEDYQESHAMRYFKRQILNWKSAPLKIRLELCKLFPNQGIQFHRDESKFCRPSSDSYSADAEQQNSCYVQ